jgi:hypothetical protein
MWRAIWEEGGGEFPLSIQCYVGGLAEAVDVMAEGSVLYQNSLWHKGCACVRL